MEKNLQKINDEKKVNKFAACSRCANNGCKFCPKCDGYSYWKLLIECPVTFNEKAKKQKEYQREYYKKNKAEIQKKRRAYFAKYYHEVIKNKPDAVTLKRARSLKYYYDHHDEIRAKRNAKKKSDLLDPVNGAKMREDHTNYMRDYRQKKKECSTINQKDVIMACGSKKSGGKKPPKK